MFSPIISWSDCFLFKRKLRTEAWRTKSKGVRGHPYLSPLEALKKSVALPFTKGAIHGSLIHALIQLMNLGPNPNLCKTSNRNLSHLMKGALTTIPFSFRVKLEWIASWTRIKLSTICLLWIKPPWFSGVMEGRMVFILLAITFVISLLPMLQREIGRNLEKVLAPFSLGIRAKKAELVLPPIFWQAWDFRTILHKSANSSVRIWQWSHLGPGPCQAPWQREQFWFHR